MDLKAVEARTQAIGQALFAAAKREHASLSVLNRWTAQVLSWCLADPAVKAAILRFIDALPALTTPREIAQHLREYFPPGFRVPAALRLGTQLARPGLVTQGAMAMVVRQLVEQVARQFIAEHQPEAASRVIHELASRGATVSLDLLGEQVLSEPEADRYVTRCLALLTQTAEAYAALPASSPSVVCGPRVNCSVKPSALTSRFDPISPSQSLEQATRRVLPLLACAEERGAVITLDMEQYELRDLTLALAKHLLVHPAVGRQVGLGIVIQAYLRDADAVTEALVAWCAAHERPLTIRLVKGAYWDAEVAQATQARWPVPVYQSKAETDLAFERLTRRLLGASPLVTTAIASHNVRSIAHAMAVAEALGLGKEQLEFQLLYGMGEALQGAIVSMGYPVRVYTPIGELIPGMAYLVRRILENTANESFLRQDFFQHKRADELLRLPVRQAGLPATPRGRGAGFAGEPSFGSAQDGPPSAGEGEPLLDGSREAHRQRMAEALTAVQGAFGRAYPLLLGEETRPTSFVPVRNPARPSQELGAVSRATAGEVNRAVALAASTQPQWAALPVGERTACLRRAADLIRARRFELAAWEAFEVGKTWREADADVVEAIEYLEYYSRDMEALARGKPLAQMPGERNAYTYEPRGVAAVISPWNFPAAILTGMASAALVSGHAVILKPAGQASIIAAHLAQLFRQAGAPPGVLQFLPGRGEEVGAALVAHPGVQLILFTGSRAVGLSILNQCAQVSEGQRFVKQVVAELGGKNAIVVDADADLDAVIAGTLRSAFGYGGQKCSAASRLIVLDAVYDRLLPRLVAAVDRLVVGDPADPATDLGPLIEDAARRRLQEALAHARRVATVAYEYPAPRLPAEGYFVGPAIVTDVPPDDRLAQEELFGPLLCVFRVKTFDDALRLANDTAYGLTGGVYSRSPSHIQQAIRAFDVGNLYINRPITGARVGRQPFGGRRLSGLGTKAGGPDYLAHLVLPKTVCINTARYGIPLD